MRAAAKSSKPCTRASVGIFEPPEAGEIEVFGKAQYETDDSLNITVVVIVDPKGTALRRVLARKSEARDLRVVGILIFVATLLEQRERTGSIVGRADVDQARKMGEVVRRRNLLKMRVARPMGRALIIMSGTKPGRSAGRPFGRGLARSMLAEHLPVEPFARRPKTADCARVRV